MQNSKLQSGFKKVVSVLDNGIEPIAEGVKNFNNPINEIETLAEGRALTCVDCVNYIIEPIESFRVTDIRIPELSEMFCDDCGCTLSYKLRQTKTKCPLWKK